MRFFVCLLFFFFFFFFFFFKWGAEEVWTTLLLFMSSSSSESNCIRSILWRQKCTATQRLLVVLLTCYTLIGHPSLLLKTTNTVRYLGITSCWEHLQPIAQGISSRILTPIHRNTLTEQANNTAQPAVAVPLTALQTYCFPNEKKVNSLKVPNPEPVKEMLKTKELSSFECKLLSEI